MPATQTRSSVSYAIAPRGCGSRNVWALHAPLWGDADLCLRPGERVFSASVPAIYELRAGSHKMKYLTRIYYAQNTPRPLRNLSATRCGAWMPSSPRSGFRQRIQTTQASSWSAYATARLMQPSPPPLAILFPLLAVRSFVISPSHLGLCSRRWGRSVLCMLRGAAASEPGATWICVVYSDRRGVLHARLIVSSLREHLSHHLKDKSEPTERTASQGCLHVRRIGRRRYPRQLRDRTVPRYAGSSDHP